MVRITVCRSCAWSDTKIRREVKRLRSKHEGRVRVTTKDCLDHCKKDPVVRVGRKELAPAGPGKLRRAVEKALAKDRAKPHHS